MRTINIGIRHYYNLVVAEAVQIEFITSNTGSKRRYQRSDLFRPQHFVQARAFDIENFTAKRQLPPDLIGRVLVLPIRQPNPPRQ